MGQRKYEAGLVGVGCCGAVGGLRGQDEEAGVVVLVVLDGAVENLQPIKPSGVRMTDGGVSMQVLAADGGGCASRIVGQHHFVGGMGGQVVATLCQGYGVGVHLDDAGGVVLGEAEQAMLDVQLVLADDAHAALAQEFVVVEQAARDGIFDGHEAEYGTVCLHGAKEGLECVATDELQRLAFKVLVGGDVVEGTADALYCNLSHGLWMVRAAGWKGFRQRNIAPFQQKFPPRLLRSGNPVYFYLVVLSVDEHAVPLRLLSKVKIGIGVKVGGEPHAILLVFLYYFWQR